MNETFLRVVRSAVTTIRAPLLPKFFRKLIVVDGRPLGGGRWQTRSELPAGNYAYRLVVDGAWMQDPGACESVPNPFGGRNSVLTVPMRNPPPPSAA